jgi:diguanylate cyclase (GGDEF)-like protein/PAS domain S-box-containing protein
MLQFADDEMPIQSRLTGKGELAILGNTFNLLVRRLNENRNSLTRQKNLYNTLSKTNQMITRINNQQTLFNETCQIIVDHGGFILAWIGLTEDDSLTKNVFASAGIANEFLLKQPDRIDIPKTYVLNEVITQNRYIVINDYLNDPLTKPWHDLARQVNIQSCAAFPVTCFNQVIAELKIYSDSKDYFTTDIINLLKGMAEDVSFALNNLKLNKLRKKAENDIREREENLSITLNAIGDAVITTDEHGLITRMNPVAESLTGWALNDAKGGLLTEVFNIINVITRKPVENPVQKVLAKGQIVGLANHTALISKNGTEYQIADSAAPITNKAQKIIGVILVFQDVTEQYKINAALLENERRFRHVNEVSGAYVWEVDNQNRYIYITDQVTQVKGYTPQQLLGHQPFEFMPEADVEPTLKIVQNAVANKGSFELTHRNITPDGNILWEEVKGQVLLDEQGNVIKIRGAGVSINERKEAEAEIKKLAYYDPLTNLPNRRMICDRLEHELSSAVRHNNIGAILFFDLDLFKNLNDSLGHDAGDELLIQIAERMQQQLRTEDTAARLGGDEFVVLLCNISANQENAVNKVRKVTEKIHQALLETYFLKGYEYHLSISIGITLFPQKNQNVNDLLKQADTALYRAKENGGNNYQFFRQEMQDAAHKRLQIEKELHIALSSEQLQLYYQPQLNAEGRLIGAEALIRWMHPEKGLIAPDQFIPVAEESGLILSIGLWVLKTAFTQMKKWQQNQQLGPNQKLSINISPKQFKQENFVKDVSFLLLDCGISADLIIFEITENLLLTEIDETISKMHQLKKLGINFSIDNFGTGYSSLAYLKRLSLAELKIDRTFINDIYRDINDQIIIETIIAMAKHMQIQVIAEGVETCDQIEFLKKNGCHHYQGNYFSEPLDNTSFEKYLVQHQNT